MRFADRNIRHPRHHHWLTGAGLALLLTACGGGGGGGGDGGNDSPPAADANPLKAAVANPLGHRTDCPGLTLSATHGSPGTVITVTGLPADFGEASIRVIADGDAGQIIDPLFLNAGDEGDPIRFTTPLAPTRDPEGGNVMMELGDGDQHCPAFAFTIDALPQAPDDYTRTVRQRLETWVDKSLAVLGYNPQTLLDADPDTLPQQDLSFWVVKQYVSGDRPDGLKALAAQASDDPDKLLERLLMASGLEDDLVDALNELDTVPVGMRQTSQAATKRAHTRVKINGSCDEQSVDPDKLIISGAAELSARMKSAAAGYVFDGSVSGQVLGDASLVNYKNTGQAAGYAGTTVSVISEVKAMRRALEPQSITDFEVRRVDQSWIEDRDPANPAFWDLAFVKAKGKSFNFGATFLNGLVTLAGMVPGPVGASIGTASTLGSKGVSSAINSLTEGSCVRIRAPEYGPIDVTDEPWTTSKILGTTVTRDSHRQYHGIDIGTSQLVIKLNSGEFADEGIFLEKFPVTVKPIRISLLPSFYRVQQPGEVASLSATAANASKNAANFAAQATGPGQIQSAAANGDFYDVQFKTPDDRDNYPTSVTFTWQGRTLPAGTERSDSVTIDTEGDISLTPQSACLLPGNRLSLSAQLNGFAEDNQDVTFSTSGGQIIDASGLTATLVAPGQTGTVQVTVKADADPSVKDTAEYTVSDSCIKKLWYPGATISLDGNGTYSNTADTRCPPDNHNDTQSEEITTPSENVIEPPQIPPENLLWYTRSERIQQNYTHTSTRSVLYTPPNGGESSCDTVNLHGSNDSTVVYSSTGDGTLSASLDAQLNTSCEEHQDGDVACAGGGTAAGLGGMYYIDLSAETDYRVHGELDCAGLAGRITQIPISATLIRYVGGVTPFVPDQETGNTGVRDANGNYRSPGLFTLSCTQANQTLPFDISFTLDAPQGEANDLVVLSLAGGLWQVSPANLPKDGFGLPSPTLPDPNTKPTTGDHQSTAHFDFSITLESQ
ncbi:hypothetical protein A11A3_08235 [Alcanivorax hongdengensis A-11-3]|uniref:Uncharacterized protein n=1 Tax=Alcanivorax hongdengensis A-11-3 TaxID=1177179 RepID=L0WFK4_9GAMM|nr:hypothetical protein [Alcanivorax hongdengensis]EKF74600.1 hypothetical protein A11A3_08235 [Alcanivorax hongdengensis A-11-3]